MKEILDIMEAIEKERDKKIQSINQEYQEKLRDILISKCYLEPGKTKLVYHDDDGEIEGTFLNISKLLKITIRVEKVNGQKDDEGDTMLGNYKDFYIKDPIYTGKPQITLEDISKDKEPLRKSDGRTIYV